MKTNELTRFIEGIGVVQSILANTCERRGEFADIKFLQETKVFLVKNEGSIFVLTVTSQENENLDFVVDSVVCQFGVDPNLVLENNFIEGIKNFIEL